MVATRKNLWLTAAIMLVFAAPTVALAQEDCKGPWLGRRDCPRSEYSPLHYWAPGLYQVRAWVHPSNLDQYPPGVPAPVNMEVTKSRCRTLPPMATSPYADPFAYFGRTMAPQK